MQILMLEDNEDRIRMIQSACAKREWDLVVTKTVEEFESLACSVKYDLFFLDHDLGYRKTGMDAVDRIVNGKIVAPDTVYVHSANCVAAPRMVQKLQEAGVNAYQIDFLSLWEGIRDSSIEL